MKTYHPDYQKMYDRCEQVRDGYPVGHVERKKITIQMANLQLKIKKGELL